MLRNKLPMTNCRTGILVMECKTAIANPMASKVCGTQNKKRSIESKPVILAQDCTNLKKNADRNGGKQGRLLKYSLP